MRVLRAMIMAFSLLTILVPAHLAMASVGQIMGTILDEKSGEPLIGASVQVEGTTIGDPSLANNVKMGTQIDSYGGHRERHRGLSSKCNVDDTDDVLDACDGVDRIQGIWMPFHRETPRSQTTLHPVRR